MSLGTILLIILVLMLIGAIPSWPHSRSWGRLTKGKLKYVKPLELAVTGK